MQKKWLTKNHFIKIEDGKFILWDYLNHSQFELTKEYLDRLVDFSVGDFYTESKIDKEISDSGVIGDNLSSSNWKWDWLSHIFHYGTNHPEKPSTLASNIDDKNGSYSKDYLDFCESISSEKPPIELTKPGLYVELPPANLTKISSASLWKTLRDRRTCRDFNGDSVSLEDISSLLYATFGDQKSKDPSIPENYEVYGYRRTSPSSGGLQCTEAYVWVLNIDGLEPGLYHYQSTKHALTKLDASDLKFPIGTYLCNQNWANDMAFAVIITCNLEKLWWKYPHSRAYRPMLIEVGHFSQTLNLCMTALGIKPWLTGFFHDVEIAELLNCNPETEHPIFVVGGGYGSGSSISREEREIMSLNGRDE